MEKQLRYDEALKIEACRFVGLAQPFPSHFHEYYVLGLVEQGTRRLTCNGQTCTLRPGSLVLFNPGDTHGCTQCDGGTLDYRALHISRDTMRALAGEITGRAALPIFTPSTITDNEAAALLRTLHESLLRQQNDATAPEITPLYKEETLLLLLTLLLRRYSQPFDAPLPPCRAEVDAACQWMQTHYAMHLTLADIARSASLSKSALLRAFTKEKGVTPYNYLLSIRIGRARRLLEGGTPPAQAALQTGFADQSHFTNCFRRFIGLSPGVYREIFAAESTKDEEKRKNNGTTK